jgi:hypothetical protein
VASEKSLDTLIQAFGEGPHFRDALFHPHFMNLERGGDIRGATHEPIRLGAGIRNLHVASGDGSAFRSGTRPWARDFKRPDLVIAGLGCGRRKADEASQQKNETSHDAAPV